MKKIFSILLAVVFVLGTVSVVSAKPVDDPSTRDAVGVSLVGLNAQGLFGGTFDDSIFTQADCTVMNYWATWCGPCLGEMPDFRELHAYYESTPEADVQLFGILMYKYQEEIQEAQEIVTENNYNWQELLLTEQLEAITRMLSDDGSVPVPQTIIVDRTGTVRAHKRGRFFSYNEMYNYINGWYETLHAEMPPVLVGDVDGSGSISVSDAVMIVRMAMGIAEVTNLEAADVNGSGTVEIADAVMVLRMAMGL